MNLTKLLLILSLFSLISGQIVRIGIFFSQGAITLTDILILATAISFLIQSRMEKKKIKIPPILIIPVILFAIYTVAVNIFALNILKPSQDIVATLFLLRFLLYFFISVITLNVIKKTEIISWLKVLMIIGSFFSIIGFIQLIIFPDLTFLAAYGWDPHQKRIVSSLLDPNFSGYLYAMFATTALAALLTTQRKIYLLPVLINFNALLLTFSRSSYLAFLGMVLILGVLKSPKLIVVSAVFAAATFFAIPRVQTRILGALTFDETAQARIQSWQNASFIFSKNPFFGVGFDAYRYAQKRAGFFTSDNPQGGHSGSGVDSSLLLVLVSTGITGLVLFSLIIFSQLKIFFKNSKNSTVNLAGAASFIGLLVHSQFVNSLFFPQIMLFVFFMLGLAKSYDS